MSEPIQHPAVNHQPDLATLSPTLTHSPPADAQVARALSNMPAFASWKHQPTPASIESALLDLDAQQLMTTAAVCLLRLARMDQHHDDHADAA